MSASADAFRDAFSRWASGVSIVAVRDEERVYATTVSSLASLSAEPPQLVLSLSPGAQVLPFLPEGAAFGVSILAASQRRLATIFADAFPVGPYPFGTGDPPLVAGALATLACRVSALHAAPPARL
ncbi:MAG TPA: flavin reductase family protein, partial [Longimicrobiales bacterium]|nr:flavin reductase family protein [Longimicrobiales bacterium]